MKDLNYYLGLPYKIEIQKIPEHEGGGYCAMIPDFKGYALFYGDGETEAEAIAELKEAFKITLESMLGRGLNIPEPSTTKDDSAVQVNITLPKGLLAAIDAVTKNRSRYLANLARADLAL